MVKVRKQARGHLGKNSLPTGSNVSLFSAKGDVLMNRTYRQKWNPAWNFSLKSENLWKTSPYFRSLAWTLRCGINFIKIGKRVLKIWRQKPHLLMESRAYWKQYTPLKLCLWEGGYNKIDKLFCVLFENLTYRRYSVFSSPPRIRFIEDTSHAFVGQLSYISVTSHAKVSTSVRILPTFWGSKADVWIWRPSMLCWQDDLDRGGGAPGCTGRWGRGCYSVLG